MSTIPPAMRDLARQLLAQETSRSSSHPVSGCAAVLVCERFKTSLARLGGLAGFRSLLSRALALAKAEADSLGIVVVQDDGALGGLSQPGTLPATAEVALVANLLGLLVTFIGEPLTRQLVREAWPETPGLAPDESNGEKQ